MLTNIINILFNIYSFLVLARVLLSWIPHNPRNFIISFVYDVTDPYLGLFRRILPPRPNFPLDLSPLLALFVLFVAQNFINWLI